MLRQWHYTGYRLYRTGCQGDGADLSLPAIVSPDGLGQGTETFLGYISSSRQTAWSVSDVLFGLGGKGG